MKNMQQKDQSEEQSKNSISTNEWSGYSRNKFANTFEEFCFIDCFCKNNNDELGKSARNKVLRRWRK